MGNSLCFQWVFEKSSGNILNFFKEASGDLLGNSRNFLDGLRWNFKDFDFVHNYCVILINIHLVSLCLSQHSFTCSPFEIFFFLFGLNIALVICFWFLAVTFLPFFKKLDLNDFWTLVRLLSRNFLPSGFIDNLETFLDSTK